MGGRAERSEDLGGYVPVTQTASIWLVLVLAFCAANLPFLSQRLFGVLPLARG